MNMEKLIEAVQESIDACGMSNEMVKHLNR